MCCIWQQLVLLFGWYAVCMFFVPQSAAQCIFVINHMLNIGLLNFLQFVLRCSTFAFILQKRWQRKPLMCRTAHDIKHMIALLESTCPLVGRGQRLSTTIDTDAQAGAALVAPLGTHDAEYTEFLTFIN